MAVIHLAEERRKRARDLYGPAHCLQCDHAWISTARAGTVWLECPRCHSSKGLFAAPVAAPDERYGCRCGGEVFYVSEAGLLLCPVCGMGYSLPGRPA